MQKEADKNRKNYAVTMAIVFHWLFLHSVNTLLPEELISHLCRDHIYTLFYKPINQCRNSCSKLVEDVV